MMLKTIGPVSIVDSGSVVVMDDAIIEFVLEIDGTRHEVSVKFRSESEGGQKVRAGRAKDDRTVVHLVNFDASMVAIEGAIELGQVGNSIVLFSAFVCNLVRGASRMRTLTYTFGALDPTVRQAALSVSASSGGPA